MDIRIKEKLKNQQGSSLAFVLIIGMVIMIMVASLLAVANSDFTFTQETLESRQAYIDAKSVIEFGKIEINKRMTDLSNKNAELEGYYNEYKNGNHSPQLVTKISNAESLRAALVAALDDPFIIYGNPDNVTGTLGTVAPDAVNTAKIIKLGDVLYDANNERFTIETQGLRRKLDYQADFNYTPTTSTPITPGSSDEPGRPAGTWLNTHIDAKKKENNGKDDPVSCVIESSGEGHSGTYKNPTLLVYKPKLNLNLGTNGNIRKFDWMDCKILDLTARNIDVIYELPQDGVAGAKFYMTALGDASSPGQIRFEQGYDQVNGDINTLSAYNIVIKGNLEIDDKSYLVIKNCANLWVTGNIIINTNDLNKINDISATNIFVNGTVNNNPNVRWTYTNFWINGVKQTNYPNTGSSGETNVVVMPGKTGLISEMYY